MSEERVIFPAATSNLNSVADPNQQAPNKRAALTGQWQTPPLPTFTAAGGESAATSQQPQQYQQHASMPMNETEAAASAAPVVSVPMEATAGGIPPISNLPDSTEAYARALQEAYRRGAEAAALLAAQQQQQQQQQQGGLGSAVSCPDFQGIPPPVQLDPATATTIAELPILPPPQPVVPNPLGSLAAASLTTSTTTTSATTTTTIMPPPPPMQPTSLLQQQHHHHQQRARSMPDMASYAAQQEEEKRQKRLARNRASAKLRRLRKKNLVDAYETEVGILEKTLKKLQQHEWGVHDDHQALSEALAMDRGQQVLTPEERKQAATDILKQQLDYLQQLEELLQEQYVLYQLKDSSEFDDLKAELQLTDQQLEQLKAQSSGWEEEWNALQTVKASIEAMKDNEWLWNEGCFGIVDQFMSILHKNQISKFLLWADHNSEAIDELDIVHAPNGVPQGPVFQFGVDSNPDTMMDNEGQEKLSS